MKAILIDPSDGSIKEVDHSGSHRATYDILDVQNFGVQRLGLNGKQENDIFFDDDSNEDTIEYGFQYGDNQPLFGKGLIRGCNPNTGISTATNLTVESVKAKTRIFKTDLEFKMAYNTWVKKYQ